jgi:cytochrome c556
VLNPDDIDPYMRCRELLAAREAELAEAQAHIDGLEGEPTKALAMKWKARAEQAEAELAEARKGWDAETVKRQVADFNALGDAARDWRERAEQAEAELATVRQTRDNWMTAATGYMSDVRELEAELATVTAALATLHSAVQAHGCPVCLPVNGWGHTPLCPISAAIAAKPAPPPVQEEPE